jgi:hypothetical protein
MRTLSSIVEVESDPTRWRQWEWLLPSKLSASRTQSVPSAEQVSLSQPGHRVNSLVLYTTPHSVASARISFSSLEARRLGG